MGPMWGEKFHDIHGSGTLILTIPVIVDARGVREQDSDAIAKQVPLSWKYDIKRAASGLADLAGWAAAGFRIVFESRGTGLAPTALWRVLPPPLAIAGPFSQATTLPPTLPLPLSHPALPLPCAAPPSSPPCPSLLPTLPLPLPPRPLALLVDAPGRGGPGWRGGGVVGRGWVGRTLQAALGARSGLGVLEVFRIVFAGHLGSCSNALLTLIRSQQLLGHVTP